MAAYFNVVFKLFLAVANGNARSASIMLNVNGSFPTHADIGLGGAAYAIASASLRNNGMMDLVVALEDAAGVDVLLGNNAGAFAAPVYYLTGNSPESLTIADFNHDSNSDIAVANLADNTVAILAGNGNGTFQSRVRYATDSQPTAIASGDFNNDGFAEFATANTASGTFSQYLSTPVAVVAPGKLTYPLTELGASSAVKSVTLFNSGIATLKPKESVNGDFAISSNTCGATLASGSNCSVGVTFTPTSINTRTGTLTFTDNATVSMQRVSLSGVGTEVNLSSTSLSFGSVKVGTTSAAQTITVTNLSNANSLTFTSVAIGGSDAGDFIVSGNTCPLSPTSLGPLATCQIAIEFAPASTGTRSASLILTDNGGGSPQSVALSGSGN